MPTDPNDSIDDLLAINCEAEVKRIGYWIRQMVGGVLGKRGVVLGLSGGIDSSVCAALAVQALGPHKVFGLLLPERDSRASATDLGAALADSLGIRQITQDITSALTALDCYEQRDAAIRRLFPDYGEGWKCKLVIAGGQQGGINYFQLMVQNRAGAFEKRRLPLREYLQIVAATNYKQRVRKTIEYFHADRLNYAVIGTPNRLEFDQGFFVKNGDGAADLKPIAHLYKTQVYALAAHLSLPAAICNSTPSTDTYSLEQGQDEFYFALPYRSMDIALRLHNLQRPAEALAVALAISVVEAKLIYADITAKRRSTRYLHRPSMLLEPVITWNPAE